MSINLGDALLYFKGDLTGLNSALKTAQSGVSSTMGNVLDVTHKAGVAMVGFGGAIVGGIGMAVKGFADYAESIDTASKKTGMSTDAIQEYKFMAEQCSATLEDVTNSVKFMSNNLDTATTSGGAAGAAFSRLGLSAEDLKAKKPEEAFKLIMDALAGIPDQMTRTAISQDIFGRGALALQPMMAEGAGGMAKLRSEAHALGAVLDKEAITSGEAFGDEMNKMKAAMLPLIATIAQNVIPAVKDLMASFLSGVKFVSDFAKEHTLLVGLLVKVATGVGGLSLILGALMMVVKPLVTAWSGLSAAFGNLSGLTKSRAEMAGLKNEVDQTATALGKAHTASDMAQAKLGELETQNADTGTSFADLTGMSIQTTKAMEKAKKEVSDTAAALKVAEVNAAAAARNFEAAGGGLTRMGAAANLLKGSLGILQQVASTLLWGRLIYDAGRLAVAIWDTAKATWELSRVTALQPAQIRQLVADLERKGIAYDRAKLAALEEGKAIDYLTGLYASHTKAMTVHEAKLKGLPTLAKDVVEAIAAALKDYGDKMRDFNQDITDDQTDARAKLAEMNRDFKDKLRDAGVSLSDAMADIQHKTADALRDINAEWRKSQEEMNYSLAQANQDYWDGVNDRAQDARDNITDTQKDANDKLTDLQKQLKEATTKEDKAKIQTQIDELNDATREKLAIADREYQQAEAKAQREYQQEMQRLQRKAQLEYQAWQEKLARITEQSNEEQARANQANERATAKIREEYGKQVQANQEAEAIKARETGQALEKLQRGYTDALNAIAQKNNITQEQISAEVARQVSASVQAWQSGGADIGKTAQGIGGALNAGMQEGAQAAKDAATESHGWWSEFGSWLGGLFQSMWDKLIALRNAMWGWTGYAGGGIVGKQTNVIAGEEGPELASMPGGGKALLGFGLYSLPTGTHISTAQETARMGAGARGGAQGGGGNSVTVINNFPNLTIREEADVDKISRAIARTVNLSLAGAYS